MPAYLGGRFNVCGNKWYGSNMANTKKGLPRSILTVMLNDVETGAPPRSGYEADPVGQAALGIMRGRRRRKQGGK